MDNLDNIKGYEVKVILYPYILNDKKPTENEVKQYVHDVIDDLLIDAEIEVEE